RGLLGGGALSTNVIPQIGVHVVQLRNGVDARSLVSALQSNAQVQFAELDETRTPQALSPNDLFYLWGIQGNLDKIQAPNAWSLSAGSASVIIAIVDTGVDG